MSLTYNISKPCSEDWDKMNTEAQGRHCQVCCKTVVDFSQKSNSEIIDFLEANAKNKICGRFRSEQLKQHKVSRPLNRYRTFFAALIFVFGGMLFSSCTHNRPHETPIMGDVAYQPDTVQNVVTTDSVKKAALPDTAKKIAIRDTAKKTMGNDDDNRVPVMIEDPGPHMIGEIDLKLDTLH